MLKIRTIESVYVEDDAHGNNIADGLFSTSAHNFGHDSRVSYVNTGDLDVYLKFRNGIVKRIPGSVSSNQHLGVKKGLINHLLIQKQVHTHIDDIVVNIELIDSLTPAERDEEHLAIIAVHKQNIKNRAYEASNARRDTHITALRYAPDGQTLTPWHTEKLNGRTAMGDTRTIDNYFKLSLSTFAGREKIPVYIPYHDVLVAYGTAGYEVLKKVIHPKSVQFENEYTRFLAKSSHNEYLRMAFDYSHTTTSPGDQVRMKIMGHHTFPESERFMYSIDLIDNDARYSDLWCHMFGEVVCIKPFSRPGVTSGIYVTTTEQSALYKNKSVVKTLRYDKPDEIPNIKLYTSAAHAESSGDFRDAAEAELRVRDHVEKTKIVEKQIELNAQKFAHEVRKMQDTIDDYARQTDLQQKEALRVEAAHQRELEKQIRAQERDRIAHERELEKFRLERESMRLKQESERLKAAHDEKAAFAKQEQERIRHEQERESFETKRKFEQESQDAKMRQERKSGGLKFIGELTKYVPLIIATAYKVFNKFFSGAATPMPT